MNEIQPVQPDNTPKKSHNIVVYASIAVIAIGILYGAAAYSYRLWPFSQTTSSDSSKASKIVKFSLSKKPKVDDTGDAKVLRIVPAVETTETGDCTLVLSNDKDIYKFKNSTRDAKGIYGCLEWNISVEGYPKGNYDIKITFTGDTQHAVLHDSVKLK